MCPNGGQIHLDTWRCYWLSKEASTWREAQQFCRKTQGGDLASADSQELQNFIYHSFPAWAKQTFVLSKTCIHAFWVSGFLSFLSNIGIENLPCGFGWRDQVKMGLREWVAGTLAEVYIGPRGDAFRWLWGRTDSGGGRHALGDTLPFVRKVYLVRQKCKAVHWVWEIRLEIPRCHLV